MGGSASTLQPPLQWCNSILLSIKHCLSQGMLASEVCLGNAPIHPNKKNGDPRKGYAFFLVPAPGDFCLESAVLTNVSACRAEFGFTHSHHTSLLRDHAQI